jgi:hypothetical protein
MYMEIANRGQTCGKSAEIEILKPNKIGCRQQMKDIKSRSQKSS